MSFWAVDGFGLISGIVGYKKYKFSNLIYLWIQTCFYSILISIYLFIKKNKKMTQKQIILSFFPILIKRHWYVNAYFSMYLFLPLINYGINNLDHFIFRNLVLFFIGFYSIYDLIGRLILNKNPNYHFLNNGYTSKWLLILYIIGGYYGKYILIKENKLGLMSFFIWILLYLCSSFFNCEINCVLLKTKSHIPHNLLIKYLSPTILLETISLLMIFSKMNLKSNWIKKIISFFSPLTFNITLIHLRLFQSNTDFKIRFFKWVNHFSSDFYIFKIYLLSVFIYIFCSFIDYLRLLIFKLCKIQNFCILISKKFPKLKYFS